MKAVKTLYVESVNIPAALVDNAVCGGVENEFTTQFSVSARDLDSAGFIIEVKGLIDSIKRHFRDPYLKASCEELCEGVAYIIHKEVKRVAGTPVHIYVKVWNLTGYVSLDWTEGNEVPVFPREATDAEVADTLAHRGKRKRQAC